MTDIESKLKRIEDDPEGSGTSHLFTCIEGVSSLANRAFQPLFERQVGNLPIHFIWEFFIFFILCLTYHISFAHLLDDYYRLKQRR